MVKIAALLLLLFILVAVVFIKVKNAFVLAASLFLLVFCTILVIALNGNNIKESTSPIEIDGQTAIIYYEGEKYEVPVSSVYRVDVNKTESSKLLVTVSSDEGIFKVETGSLKYEFSLKNDFARAFGAKLNDHSN